MVRVATLETMAEAGISSGRAQYCHARPDYSLGTMARPHRSFLPQLNTAWVRLHLRLPCHDLLKRVSASTWGLTAWHLAVCADCSHNRELQNGKTMIATHPVRVMKLSAPAIFAFTKLPK